MALQTSGKKISLFKIDPATKFEEAMTKKPSFIFKEPDSNVVYDYCLIKDWRKAVEEMDEYTIGETIAIATLTLE